MIDAAVSSIGPELYMLGSPTNSFLVFKKEPANTNCFEAGSWFSALAVPFLGNTTEDADTRSDCSSDREVSGVRWRVSRGGGEASSSDLLHWFF